MTDTADERERTVAELAVRELLWLRHGCPIAALYGDDGEMQCGSGRHRPLDFKRQPLADLIDAITRTDELSSLRATLAQVEGCDGNCSCTVFKSRHEAALAYYNYRRTHEAALRGGSPQATDETKG